MAEAIGIAGSIAGLVQIAGGVFQLAFKFIKDVKDAKCHIKILVDELQILGGVLHRLSLLVASLEKQDNNTQNVLLSRQIRSCRQTLSRIEKPLTAACLDFGTDKIKSWKHQLKWPFNKEETKELLSELNRHQETLNLALTADSIETMLHILSNGKDANQLAKDTNSIARAHMNVTTRIDADQNRLKILNYFLKCDPQPIFTQALQEHHPSTCLWLIDSEEFIQWSETPGSKLWLTGIPGAGKTVLAAAMLENLIQQDTDRIGVAFFFCTYSEPRTHDAVNILCTLAAQIALQSPSAFNLLSDYYEELHPGDKLSNSADVTRLTALLKLMFNEFDQVLIVVDGLDECKDNIMDVLDALTDLAHQYGNASMALLSRDEYSIRCALAPDFEVIAIAAHEEDLQQYTVNEIERRIRKRQLRLKNPSLKDEIISALVGGADGMFRWVSCQIDHLCRLHNDRARREALRHLPPGLNATYERILERITSTNEEICLLVSRVLLLITFASPSLTIPELCGALAACDDIGEFDKNVEIDEEEIAFHCTSLIRKSANGERFELAHFTVREFLEQKVQGGSKFGQYHLGKSRASHLLLECSLRFLLLKNFSRHPEEAIEEESFIEHRNGQHPFYEYASKSIAVLANALEAFGSTTPLVMRLFHPQKSPNFTSWALELLRHYRHGSWNSWVMSRTSPGFVPHTKGSQSESNTDPRRETAPELEGDGSNIHSDNQNGSAQVPQHEQYHRHGSTHVSNDDTNIYSGGPVCHSESLHDMVHMIRHSSFSTLHMASLLGLPTVCREILTIDNQHVNACSEIGTPLHCALGGPFLLSSCGFSRICDGVAIFERPCLDTMELLISYGGDCSAKMESSAGVLTVPLLALIVSSLLEDFKILERILREEPSVNEILKVLVATSNASESQLLQTLNSNLSTTWADVLRIVEFVVARVRDDAKKIVYGKIMEQLQSRGYRSVEETFSHPSITSSNLSTEIELAIMYNDAQWLDHLLSTSRKYSAMPELDWLLQSAFEQLSEAAFRFLLSNGACGKLSNGIANGFLLRCCTNEMIDFLVCLLDSNIADDLAVDHLGNTIYHLAAKEGSEEILKCLLAQKNEATKRLALQMMNHYERTPLAEAILHGNYACAAVIMHLPESHKAILQCKTPSSFSSAASMESPETIQMLAQADLIPGVEDGSPLHCIDYLSNPYVLQCLLSIYPYTRRDSDGRTPMDIFADWCLVLPFDAPSEAHMKTMELLSQHESVYTSKKGRGQALWQKIAKRLCSESPASEYSASIIFQVALHSKAIAAYEASVNKNAIAEFEPIFTAIETFTDSPAVAASMIPILELSVHREWFESEAAFQALRWSVVIGCTENVRYLTPRVMHEADPERLNRLTQTGEGLGLLHLASSRAYYFQSGDLLLHSANIGALHHALCRPFHVPWPQYSGHSWAEDNRQGLRDFYAPSPFSFKETVSCNHKHWRLPPDLASDSKPSPMPRPLAGEIYPAGTPRGASYSKRPQRPIEDEKDTARAIVTLTRIFSARDSIPEILLGSGIDPNCCSRETGMLPLSMHLCMNAPLAVLKTLLDYDAQHDSGSADRYGWTPVAWACLLGRLDFLQYLVRDRKCTDMWYWKADARVHFFGAQLTVESVSCTALHLATLSRDIEIVKFVLRHMELGVSYLHGNPEQCTPLHLALQRQDMAPPELLNLLIRHGADVNAPGPRKWSPLHHAAYTGNVKAVSILIRNGAVGTSDHYGKTPTLYALEAGHYSVIPLLGASAKYDLSLELATNAEAQNAIAQAFEEIITDDNVSACRSLIVAGCPLNIKMPSCHQCTPLLFALWLDRTVIVDILLSKGADVRYTACQKSTEWPSELTKARDGVVETRIYPSMTPLDMMLREDIFSYSLRRWLSLLSESQFRWLAQNSTAAHVAVERDSTISLDILLSHAAGVKDELGSPLSHHLVNVPFPEFPEGMRIPKSRTTPLNRAISKRNFEAARILIEYGADTSVTHHQGPSALHFAAQQGSLHILELILSSSQMINSSSKYGINALSYAIWSRRHECVQLLLERGARAQSNLHDLSSNLHVVAYKEVLEIFLDQTFEACSEYTCTITEVLAHVFSYKLKPNTTRHSHVVMANMVNLIKIPTNLLKLCWKQYCNRLTSKLVMHWDVRGLALGVMGARLILERAQTPGHSFSALSHAASLNLLPVVEGLLRAGFHADFIDDELGSPLMAALRSGQREVVKLLIRQGCSLGGTGDIMRYVAAHFPDIIDWLLVRRFIEQAKLTASDEDKEPEIEKLWSGFAKLRFPLCGNHRQEWDETDFEYTIYLYRLRQAIVQGHGIHSIAALANQPRQAVIVTR